MLQHRKWLLRVRAANKIHSSCAVNKSPPIRKPLSRRRVLPTYPLYVYIVIVEDVPGDSREYLGKQQERVRTCIENLANTIPYTAPHSGWCLYWLRSHWLCWPPAAAPPMSKIDTLIALTIMRHILMSILNLSITPTPMSITTAIAMFTTIITGAVAGLWSGNCHRISASRTIHTTR